MNKKEKERRAPHGARRLCYTVRMKTTREKILSLLLALLLCALPAAGCAGAPGMPAVQATAAPDAEAGGAEPVLVQTVATEAPAPPPMPTATPEPDALRPPEGAYTIAWLSDTQHYSNKYPALFYEQTEFLQQNVERLRLAYVVHTGDLVNDCGDAAQWEVADGAMQALSDIPHGVCAGNHDVGSDAEEYDYAAYCARFGQARFADKPWYGGGYADNRGHYDLIDAGGTRFVFAYMGYHIDQAGMDWLNETFAAYPDRVGVLCVHSYFDSDCTLTDQGRLLYDGVVAKNPNLYLVLCGHRYNSACVPAVFDDDGDGTAERTVLQMICNYQAAGHNGGDAYLRLMQVDEAAGQIHILTYSPLHDDFVYYDTPERRAENHSFDPAGEQGSVPIPWP